VSVVDPAMGGPGGRPQEDLSSEEKSFATRIDAGVQRRICDCATCVRHAIRLTQQQRPIDCPAVPGVRFVHLRGIRCTVGNWSTIYSDGWTAYNALSSLGYKHFVAEHKYTFKQICRDAVRDNQLQCTLTLSTFIKC